MGRPLSLAGAAFAVAGVLAVVGFTSPVAAHGGPAAPGGSKTVEVSLAVGVTVCTGVVAGLIGLWWNGTDRFEGGRYAAAFGVVTALVGGWLVVSVLSRPRPAVAGGLVVGAGYAVLGTGSGHAHTGDGAGIVASAVLAHRLVEGLILGSLVVAGRELAVLAAALVAAHAAVEMLVTGGYYRRAGVPWRGAAVIGLIQAGFVVAALAAAGLVGAVPVGVRLSVLAAAGTALVVAGLRECHGRFGPAVTG